MTMPVSTPTSPEQDLPPPLLQRVISNPFFPEDGVAPIVFRIDAVHPLMPTARIVRMFIIDGGVEIYAMKQERPGAFIGVRNTIPMHWVRLVEEIMHPDVLNDEIELADARADEDDDGEEGEEDDPPNGRPTAPPPEPAPLNGQGESS